jgi:hypothetical protein
MADRPCRTDADLKQIWQLLLPGTPLPACDAPENSIGEAQQETREDAAPSRPDEVPRPKSGAR